MYPTVGRIVEFVLTDKYGKNQVRPAIIVHVWSEDLVQLQVFTDGTNDGPDYASGIFWATSVHRSENKEPRTWDWMPFQKGQAQKTEQLEQQLQQAAKPLLNIPTFSFGVAIESLKNGYKVARSGWNGKGMFVVYQKGYPEGISCNKQTAEAWGLNEGDIFICNPYLQIKNVNGSHSMWVPSINDVLADDWSVIG